MSTISNIQLRYSRSKKEASEFEVDLHDLWFIFYQAAKNTVPESPLHDRLVLQIIQARELGPLRRGKASDANIAMTSDGAIWTDLPFLPTDMVQFWSQDWAGMSLSQRLGFTTFLAKLASVGICNNKLSNAGLTVLRDALETPRPLGKWGESNADHPVGVSNDVTIAELLPCVNLWLYHAGHKLIQLAEDMWESDAGTSPAGELFRENASRGALSGGCSPGRWMFWLERLQQIRREAYGAGDAQLAEYATKMVGNMLLMVEERDSAVREKLQDSHEIVQEQLMVQEFPPMQ
ncbi:hypothetical protein NQ176_g1779 [Zarea fungicola]|uniref:Uncharacterized protein n=1 Tax=Zarea fungicola TaxID=93591 RepID=A0ACC1NTS6_9HYPO|nr:hypothetical protein NQ176_g1779 [Lecanicillium fungicola]